MKCLDCNEKEGEVNFSEEPMFAITHNQMIKFICRGCYIKRIEDSLQAIQLNLKQQKQLLRKEKFLERNKNGN